LEKPRKVKQSKMNSNNNNVEDSFDEDDEWSDICMTYAFEKCSSDKYEAYHSYTYYQTYGGGGEGGYITNGKETLSVSRDWGTSWVLEPVKGELIFRTVEHDKWNSTKQLRLLDMSPEVAKILKKHQEFEAQHATPFDCSICERNVKEFGNNARPVKEGKCCNQCNNDTVIPVRIQKAVKHLPETIEKIKQFIETDNDNLVK
jgi:hypothetical protein